MSDSKGLGRFFKADETGDAGSNGVRDFAEADRTISALQARITELEGAVGRPSFIDMDEDALTQIAAEDAAVIIRAARLRAGKLIEQATDTLQQAESEREQIRASCELDARQTREAANVDARKLRAEATATLETARDQAAQLLEATQNDADSQAFENQKVIAKLLEDATRRANEVASEAEVLKANVDKDLAAQRAQTEQELAALRANTESELNNLRSETDKSTSSQIAAAQAEAKRLQTEATNAAQAMLEKATGDAQALLAKSTGDARALGEDSSKSHAATIADAQAKLQAAEKQAELIVSQAQTKADEIVRTASQNSRSEAESLRQAAIAYRDNVLVSVDANRKVLDDLTKRIADLRAQWFDAQSTMTQIANQAGARFTEAEAAAADVFARITDSRAALTDTFGNFAQEIKANSKTEDN
jgi:cell division septum initiation protein DivIVA